jgi:hypothetical protein
MLREQEWSGLPEADGCISQGQGPLGGMGQAAWRRGEGAEEKSWGQQRQT